MFDNFYIAVFNHYKKTLGKRSLKIALFYINVLELSVYLAIGSFFLAFSNQMKIMTMSSPKFWFLFSLLSLCIIFKNWMRYNGKKRNILNAKIKAKVTSIYKLWLFPIGCLLIAMALWQLQ